MLRSAAASILSLFAALPAVAQTPGNGLPATQIDRSLTGSTGAPPSDCIRNDPRPACEGAPIMGGPTSPGYDIAAVRDSQARNQAPSPGATIQRGAGARSGVLGNGQSVIEGAGGDVSGQTASGRSGPVNAQDRLNARTQFGPPDAAAERDRLAPATADSGPARISPGSTSGRSATPSGGRAAGSSSSRGGGGSGR